MRLCVHACVCVYEVMNACVHESMHVLCVCVCALHIQKVCDGFAVRKLTATVETQLSAQVVCVPEVLCGRE